MAIVKKISELTPKGSNLGNTDLLIVGVDNGTDYDLKSVTGAQLLGTVVSQTITDSVTTKSPSENAVYDALALKVDKVAGSRLITTAEGTILGNTSGTNTGDETVTTIKTKLGITTLSGSNTGDQDLSTLLVKNTAITGAIKTKITYDSKGLVTSGADATTADITDSSNKRYVTDANLTVIGNTSGTNTGDQDLSTYQPYTTATTGAVISFVVPQVYNSVASPSSSNITDSLTSAKIGLVQKIYHNHTVAPTFPAGWVKMGTATYTTSTLNVIFAEWVSSTRVEYWITKPS